jgi:hypothetical protein
VRTRRDPSCGTPTTMCPQPRREDVFVDFTRGASYSRPERRLRASKASSGELLVKDYDRTSQNHDQKGRHPLVPSQGGREGEQEGRHDGDPRDKRESAMLQTSYASPASYPSSWCPWEAISA